MTDELVLAAEFPTPTRDDWLELVGAVLKGADFDRKLVTHTADGIDIQPLYVAEDVSIDPGLPGSSPYLRGTDLAPRPGASWDVRATIEDPDPAVANRTALDELLRGSTSLSLHLRDGGVLVNSADDLDRLLEGVYLDLLPVALQTGGRFTAPADWLREVWSRRGVGGAEVSGCLGVDPLGALARDGSLHDAGAVLEEVGAIAARTASETPNVRAVAIDLGPYVEAGATPAQQLGILLSSGVAYLRALEAAGLDVATAARQIEVTLVLDADFFTGIALCRAARRVWASLLAESGVADADRGLHLQARTAERILTTRDPWVNLLRITTSTLAAGLGGADGVTSAPFDSALGVPSEQGRRLARNTQLVLLEESNSARVLDPAGGSWYIESLSEQLAVRGWARFAELETDGGVIAALADGSLAAQLAASWDVRRKLLATRREPITGVSEFPSIDESPVVREPARTVVTGGLPRHRDAEDIEALRDRADAFAEATGHRPQVFLANLGPIATHTARSTWAKNFFEAGGIEAPGNDGFADPESAAAAFRSSGAVLAVLASSDVLYAELAEATATALVAAGAARVYLAGNPGDSRAAYEAAGVAEFVHVGVDLVEVLGGAHDLVEATR